VPDRVLDNVGDRRVVLAGVFDDFRPVPPPEKVVDASVPVVERAGIAAVQVAHPLVEVGFRRLDDEMEVIAHQAVHVQLPLVTLCDTAEEADEEATVLVVDDDRCVIVAACDDVVDGTWFEMPQWTAHAATVAGAAGAADEEASLARLRHDPDTCQARDGANQTRGFALPRLGGDLRALEMLV
jgi:hypothetical protein